MLLFYFLLTLLLAKYGSAKSLFNGVEEASEYPRFLNTEDSRTDGISHEINQVLVGEYLKATSLPDYEREVENFLVDLTKPGTQRLSLSYWDDWTCKRTDYFLRFLIDTGVSNESNWIIDARGMWGFEGNISLLAVVIRTLPAVAEFHWDTQRLIPAIILESLQQSQPDCRLYYTIPFSRTDLTTSQNFPFNMGGSSTEQNILHIAQAQQILEETTARSILDSKNLYSLKGHISHTQLQLSEKLDLVHQILLTCPNIRELELKIDIDPRTCNPTIDVSGCRKDPSRNAILAFDFTKHGGTLPPLEVLKLEGYRFDFAVDGTHVDPEVNMPLEMANLHAWLKHMDWTHLHSLHLSDPLTQTLRVFADTLPNLRHFRIDGGNLHHVRAPVLKYLAKIPPLESLAIEEGELHVRPLDPLLDIIQNNHSTLRSFKLNHQRDGPRAAGLNAPWWPNHFQYSPDQFLSIAQLDHLFEICPDLQSLDLDVPTKLSWDYGILDKLLSFPQLRELTLRFPPEKIGQLYDGIYQHSKPDLEELKFAMRGLRSYLRKGKVGEPFQVLRTFLGWKEFGDKETERGPSYMTH